MCTAKERLALLEQPYLTGAEFSKVLNRSPSVVNREHDGLGRQISTVWLHD